MRWPRRKISTVARVLARHRVVVATDVDVVVDADPRHFPFGIFVGAFGQPRKAGRSISAKALARQPGSFLKGRWFRSSNRARSALLSSLRLKKRCCRSRASIQRVTTSTPFSTLALSGSAYRPR